MLRALSSAALLSCAAAQAVEQIHIFEAAAGSMHVAWATQTSVATNEVVQYGLTPSMTLSATATSVVFSKNMTTPLRLHDVTLNSLQTPNAVYYYRIGDDTTVRNFTSGASRAGGKTYLVLADLGVVNDIALAPMVEATAAGEFDAVLHSGDFAYDLQDNGGELGNTFMNGIQPIASALSYAVGPGNHEADSDSSFAQYQARFAGAAMTAGAASGSNTALYYSYNDGLAHITVIDSEQFYYDPASVDAQYTWLAGDLAAVDRTATPWLIVLAHKGYWMKKTNYTTYMDLFHTYGVDLVLAGHEHMYERTFPVGAQTKPHPECMDTTGPVNVYQPCDNRTIYVITGSPGCSGGIDTSSAPADALAFSLSAYGYGKLQIINGSTAHYWWTETVTKDANGNYVRVPAELAGSDEFYVNRA